MHTISITDAPINQRGGQESYLLLKRGQFGSQNLAVTWVDCAPGGEQLMHTHAAEEQVYVIVRGRGLMKTGDETRDVSAGTLIFVPPGTPHAIRNTGEDVLTFISAASPPMDTDALPEYFAYKPQ
jgi:mannose-6-phosphate isomerase-like protein (cupin superfamily)